MNILIADDEVGILKILNIYLTKEGLNCFLAKNGSEARNIFYDKSIDLAILDWMMPEGTGIELCKEFKSNKDIKIVLLTAKISNDDEFMGFQYGADDYIKKPFDPRLVVIRIKKLLNLEGIIKWRGLKIDLSRGKIFRNHEVLELNNKEFLLFKYLFENKNSIITREKLLNGVWGFNYTGDSRTVDTHIRRLREKIGEDLIKTNRGIGYSMED